MLHMELAEYLRHKRALASNGVRRGSVPSVTLPMKNEFFTMLIAGVVIAIIVSLITSFLLEHFKVNRAAQSSLKLIASWLPLCVVWLHPWPTILLEALFRWRTPDFERLRECSLQKHALSCLSFGFFLSVFLLWSYAISLQTWNQRGSTPSQKTCIKNQKPFKPATKPLLITWTISVAMLWVATKVLSQTSQRQRLPNIKKLMRKPLPFSLWLGESTGRLSERWHQAGLAPQQQVALSLTDATQNILILGAIGSGKTTSVMHPLLLQLLDQDCGGLIFDIKGDFHQAVKHFATTLKPYHTIGPGFSKMNLLAGLSPELAASFLKSALLQSNSTDSFWGDTATELCRNVLGLLFFTPHYSLQGLYRFCFETDFQTAQIESLLRLIPSLDLKQQRLLQSYHHYYAQIFTRFDEKVKAGVLATIAQTLSPFNHPELIDAFCDNEGTHFQAESILEGAVYLVRLPLSQWGLGAKVIITFLKLKFFNVMQQRDSRPEWNQSRPVFLMCDEYQEIVSANKDGLSDLNFWDKSRSSKTIGIISAQSIASFQAAIGNTVTAQALLQNFRQKICFKVEDEVTINTFKQLLGITETLQRSNSQSNSASTGDNFKSTTQSSNTSTISHQQKTVLDGQLFRTLPPFHALALLTLNGQGCDDVLKMTPLYL